MTKKLWLGAVAYDPKVVTIWEGMKSYLSGEANLEIEVVLHLSYEAQVEALLSHKIDIAWNTNLAYVQCERLSGGKCLPIAMRDTDLGWRSLIIALKGGAVTQLSDLRGHRLGLGSRDSGHAAILPIHFLEQEGLTAGLDYDPVRFDTDVGKHGDTGTSESSVLRAVLNGEVAAGAIGSPFWKSVVEGHLVPDGVAVAIWTSQPYSHCMFTARSGLEDAAVSPFKEALLRMSFDNPAHRPVLEMEGLKRWIVAETDGYEALRAAADRQGFFA